MSSDNGKCQCCGRDLPPGEVAADCYSATPKAEARHFLGRSVTQLHRARQALERLESKVLAFELSEAINKVEEVSMLALELTPPTH